MTQPIVVRIPDHVYHANWRESPRVRACVHEWESVFAEIEPGRFADVDRCRACRAPRCVFDSPVGPCVLLREHTTAHLLPNGDIRPQEVKTP